MSRRAPTLPKPQFTATGLENWLATVGASVPLPPGPPEGWTCLVSSLGPQLVLFKSALGYGRIGEPAVLRAVLGALGRPVDATEHEALLLVTPIPASVDVVDVFAGLIRDDDPEVRRGSCMALGLWGDERSGSEIAARLDDEDRYVRHAAAEALGHLGATKFVGELAGRPWDEDRSVSVACLEAIERLGAWDEVGHVLHRDAPEDVWKLVDAIFVATQQDDTTALEGFLSHTERDFQRVAARIFAGHRRLAEKAVPSLLKRLPKGGDEAVQVFCAQALGAVGEDALESLIELLEVPDSETRAMVCVAFSVDARLAGSAVDELRALVRTGRNDEIREASLALLIAGAADFRAEAVLRGEVGVNAYGFTQRAAARFHEHPVLAGAGMLYGQTPAIIEDVWPCFDNYRAEPRMREVGAYLLALHDPELAAPLLERLARDASRNVPVDVRRAASAALLLTGEAPTFLPVLHRVLLCHGGDTKTRGVGRTEGLDRVADQLMAVVAKDGDSAVRFEAARLLQTLGADAHKPYQALLAYSAQHDPDKGVRDATSMLLSRTWGVREVRELLADTLVAPHGVDHPPTRAATLRELAARDPVLGGRLARAFIGSTERFLVRTAARILGSTAAPSDVPALVELGLVRLSDSTWVPREAACFLLGHLPLDGALLDEVADALRARAGADPDDDVRKAANAALLRLGLPSLTPAAADSEDEE